MATVACLITHKPNEKYLNFLNTFVHYDVFVIIDDNETNYDSLREQYPKLNLIQIDNKKCDTTGFKNVNYLGIVKTISGWDKALYYFAHENNNYSNIWFFEDDVFFYNEATLVHIDETYENIDLLMNQTFERDTTYKNINQIMKQTFERDNKIDLWKYIHINFPPPYYIGMVCICRMSRRVLESIQRYATEIGYLFFLEALFPTMTIRNCYSILHPIEFADVLYKGTLTIDISDKDKLFHPIKDMELHMKIRKFFDCSVDSVTSNEVCLHNH